MRAIICGDVHIGAVFGLGRQKDDGGNTRVDDYETTLNYIVDYAISTKADMFIQTGDLFETRSPSPEHMDIADRAIKRLANANIAAMVIMGNHDYRRSGDTFTSAISALSAKDYPRVRLILNPQILTLKNKSNIGANILLIPYRDKRMYDGSSDNRISSRAFNEHIKDLVLSINNGYPTLAVGHNFFFEGSYNEYGGSELLADPKAFVGCDAVIMGHHHQHRVIQSIGPLAIYSGSMERTNFGDAKSDKFFIDYSFNDKSAKYIKIPSRGLIDASIDLSEHSPESLCDALNCELLKLNLNDKIVRCKINVKDIASKVISKTHIEKELYALGAHFVSKITIEVLTSRVIRNEDILNHRDDAEMFKAFIQSQNIDDEMRNSIECEAMSIISAINAPITIKK